MTKIEWADLTINPIIGCSKCSPGCENCYAERLAVRHAGNPKTPRYSRVITDGRWNGKTDTGDMLSIFNKLPTNVPKRIFVGSMGDVFHESVFYSDLISLFQYFDFYPQHTFMLLTKRPERMREFILDFETQKVRSGWPLGNVWLGVTAENQEQADRRIPILLGTPAAKRFLSVEPLLEEIDLVRTGAMGCDCTWIDDEGYERCTGYCRFYLDSIDHRRVDWIICGAETGNGARAMELKWARTLRDQCREAGVPFFFKKAGDRVPVPDDLMVREYPE